MTEPKPESEPKKLMLGRWRCAKCGHANPKRRATCRNCGAAKP